MKVPGTKIEAIIEIEDQAVFLFLGQKKFFIHLNKNFQFCYSIANSFDNR